MYLTGFADEAGAAIDTQIKATLELGWTNIESRNVEGVHIHDVKIEVLVPDFMGNTGAIRTVINAEPDVLNHNIETCERLYPKVRPEASYSRSLALIKQASQLKPGIPVKSGMMLGLGESYNEIMDTLYDLRTSGCRLLTLGQYLRPSKDHLPVERFVSPGEFGDLRKEALEIGFTDVASGPFVRSSYHAGELLHYMGDIL